MKQFDAIIIGFGKGGKTLAAELAKREQKVAVIERSDKMYGGTCINIGCIPTKTLVHLSKLTPAGSSFKEKREYYRQAIARKEEVTSMLRKKNYHNLADNPYITVYTGTGSFEDKEVVKITTGSEVPPDQSSANFYQHRIGDSDSANRRDQRQSLGIHQYFYYGNERASRKTGNCGRRLYRSGFASM